VTVRFQELLHTRAACHRAPSARHKKILAGVSLRRDTPGTGRNNNRNNALAGTPSQRNNAAMPSKLRAVMDTNVLYAALRSNVGASYEIVRRLRAGEWTLLLSNTVLTEYEEVLRRDNAELDLDQADIGPLLDDICRLAQRHPQLEPREPILAEADDEAFAQLAAATGADALITHNLAHYEPASRRGINIVTPREFLAKLRPSV
jgi:predicted nucleic acid-binding protein